ncbi:hypothetical protein [Enterococcus sp. DIV0756]|uniref:hypothetical protein n=1 Tax=Enterococcus sp. DIV0756 TaxID=2774636 RepID=UPI003F68932A
MSGKDIKNYAKFTELGDDSLKKCYLMFLNHKKVIEEQMKKLDHGMETIEQKCWYYESSIDAKTDSFSD